MKSIFDNVSMVDTRVFWSWFFRDKTMKERAEELAPYTWRETYSQFQQAVQSHANGDIKFSCPICHQNLVLDLTANQLAIGDYPITKIGCLCTYLRYEEDLEDEPVKPVFLKDIKAIDTPTGSAKLTKVIVKDAVDFINNLGMWRYLYGGYGSGKTHVLEAIKNALGPAAYYVNTSVLADRIFEATGNHTLHEFTEELSNYQVLLIDDLGAEYGTKYLYSALYRIINSRYAKGIYAPTYFTSNKTITELSVLPDDNLQRIADRLSDNRLVIPLVTTQSSFRSM